MAKKKTTASQALVPVGETRTYPIASTQIDATQVFHVPARHPSGDGPWQEEPDKLAWVDGSTGLACTILRQQDGVLGGYVGVGEDHPLFGFEVDAVPGALGISPHGGLDYAAPCEDGPAEITICHPIAAAPKRPGRSEDGDDGHSNHQPLWWFGFLCDRNHDLIPGRRVNANDLGAENGRVYRDLAYVYEQTCRLARQLRAAVDGTSDSDIQLDPASPPPVGLDPERLR
ncbi:hypothetical protein [Qipengyuania sp.]|uniref:hypothetical protein n=1 Tax=Qipengyuania sp. TaxID=2004515 RepID=UPI003AF4FDB1